MFRSIAFAPHLQVSRAGVEGGEWCSICFGDEYFRRHELLKSCRTKGLVFKTLDSFLLPFSRPQRCSSCFTRRANDAIAVSAAIKQCLPGRGETQRVPLPGVREVQGSMALRLRPCAIRVQTHRRGAFSRLSTVVICCGPWQPSCMIWRPPSRSPMFCQMRPTG